MKKRILSLFFALTLCMSLMPSALADLSDTWRYYLEEEPEQLTFWKNCIQVDPLRSTGYGLTTSGEEYHGVVLYCDAPARATLLGEEWKLNYGSISALSVEADGRVSDQGSQTPTYEVAGTRSKENNGAGTYWDLPEGLYRLNVLAGLQVYFVVGSPANVTVPKTGSTSATPAASTPSFTDVKAGAYYADAVKWAVENGITTGVTATTFSPDNTCTKAHIITFMWRAAGSPTPSVWNPFTDVTGEEYFAQAAMWAYENGIVGGTTFNGSTPCTRAATMEYFWKQAGSPKVVLTGRFTDVAGGSSYDEAVEWAVSNGITTGVTDTSFVPEKVCTRAQIVTFLYRALVG